MSVKFKKRNLEVTIEDKTLEDLGLDFEDMVLHQQLNGQHRFELSLVSGMEDDTSLKEEDFIGKVVSVQMGAQALNGKPVPFVAIIANVRSYKEHASRKHVSLCGFTPDYLMNLNRYTRAFIDKSLNDIVTTIGSEYDANLIAIACDPVFTDVIPYVTQYNETDYEFISRLAEQYGEWFYYDGDNIVFGKRISMSTIDMELRRNLLYVELNLNLASLPDHSQMYNYHEASPYQSHDSNFPPISFPPVQVASDVSENFFNNQKKEKYHSISPFYTETQDGLDTYVKAIAGKNANDLANIKGASDTFGPTICSVIEWKDKNLLTTVSKGRFVILQATHSINSVGEYRVEFIATPDSNEFPPPNPSIVLPKVGTEIARVTNNADDQNNSRIKVQFQWMQPDQETQWIRVASTAAGPGRGFYWVPEIDDEVVIAFENLNPDRPYSMATMYKSNDQTNIPTESNENNDYKGIITRSGHRIDLCDEEGAEWIMVTDKNGNSIHIDTKESNMTITALENMILNCKNMQINVEENMEVEVGLESKTTCKTSVEYVEDEKLVDVANKLEQTASEVNLVATNGDINVHGAGVASFQGGSDVKISKG